MPCNCCNVPQACSCKINDSREPNGFVLSPFAYNVSMYWIHCQYPVPYSQATWDSKIGTFLGPNNVIQYNEDGSFAVDPFFGDIHFHSRSGRGGIADGPVIPIDHWNGDGRNPLTPETPQTLVQFKTDDFEKSCRLLARSRVVLPTDIDYHIWPSEEELPFEVIDSTPYNAPFVGTKVINLPFEFGGGVTGVEIRIHCGSFDCGGVLSIQGNGAASYVNANMMSNADKCTSYGKFKGNFLLYYEDFDANNPNWQCSSYIKEKVEVDRIRGTFFCGSGWNQAPEGYPGSTIVFSFYGHPPIDIECNTKWKVTYTDREGNEEIVEDTAGNVGPSSYFLDDPFTLTFNSNDSITYNGIWVSQKENITNIYNCNGCLSGIPNKCVVSVDPFEEYSTGSVTLTRVQQ